MTQVDVAALRTLLYARLVSGTHKEITERFADLGLTETAGVGEKARPIGFGRCSKTVPMMP